MTKMIIGNLIQRHFDSLIKNYWIISELELQAYNFAFQLSKSQADTVFYELNNKLYQKIFIYHLAG